MIRKQAYITEEQEALLKRQAAALGLTESALIRKGIEQIARGVWTSPRDHMAFEEEMAFIDERARTIPPTGEKRHWSREEMYDERFKRLSG